MSNSIISILYTNVLLQYGIFVIFKVLSYENHCFFNILSSKNMAWGLALHLCDLTTDELGFNSRQWQEIFLFFKTSGQTLGPMFPLILNGMCAQKFQIMQVFYSQLRNPVRTKWSVCKTINLKLFFVNTVIFTATKIVNLCFNKTGNKQDNNKK
jgi:hypothetical protein